MKATTNKTTAAMCISIMSAMMLFAFFLLSRECVFDFIDLAKRSQKQNIVHLNVFLFHQ